MARLDALARLELFFEEGYRVWQNPAVFKNAAAEACGCNFEL